MRAGAAAETALPAASAKAAPRRDGLQIATRRATPLRRGGAWLSVGIAAFAIVAAAAVMLPIAAVGSMRSAATAPSDDRPEQGGADLVLAALTLSRPEAAAGDVVAFTVVARNDGPEAAPGVVVTATMPAGLAHLADDGGGAFDAASGRWSLGRMESGATARLAITTSVLGPPDGPAASGEWLGAFVPAGSGGLAGPVDLAFGPGGDLFVTSSISDSVLRYDGASGAFDSVFVAPGSGGLVGPDGLAFGPDGDLYVASAEGDAVLRYDGASGAFESAFVAPGSGGLDGPADLLFTPAGDLLVASVETASVLRYSGADGTFLGAAVASGAGGLVLPFGLALDAAGRVYVTDEAGDAVRRYDGASGAPLGDFVPSGAGGLVGPDRILFGPDGALYVSNAGRANILRFVGATGAFSRVFADLGDGDLDVASGIAFGPEGDLFVASFGGDAVARFGGFAIASARIGADGPDDPRPDNDRRAVALAIRAHDPSAAADLRLSMTLAGEVDDPSAPGGVATAPDRVTAGRELDITLHIANAGPGVALGAHALVTLPAGSGFVSGSVEGMGDAACRVESAGAPTLVRCNAGDLVAGGLARATLRAAVEPGLPDGATLELAADAGADVPEAAPGDETAARTLRVERRADLAAALVLVPEDPGRSLAVGDAIGLELSAINLGPSAASGAALSLTLPAGLVAVDLAGEARRIACDPPISNVVPCLADEIPPGEAASVTIRALLADGLPGRTFDARAAVASPAGADLDPANDRAVAVGSIGGGEPGGAAADVAVVAHEVEPRAPVPLGEVTFRIRVTNAGPAEARGVRVVHRLPPGIVYQPGSGGPAFEVGRFGGRWSIGALPSGATAEIALPARVTGEFRLEWPGGTGAPRGALGDGERIEAPGKLALGPEGDVYVASGGGAILRFDGASGERRPDLVPAGGGVRFASAVAWGPEGDLYVADAAADGVRRFDGIDGTDVGSFVAPGAGGLTSPSDLAWGPDGDLYVADQLGSRILRYEGRTGEPLGAFVPEGRGGLSVPSAIAFGPDGDLWAASFGAGEILRFAAGAGDLLGRVATGPAGLERPSAFVLGAFGDLLAGGEAAGGVWRFGQDGTPRGRYVSEGAAEAGVSGLAFGLDGHLLVSDTRRGRIGRHDGFALAWARVSVADGVDPDLTDDRRPAGLSLPPGAPPTSTGGPRPTATPGPGTGTPPAPTPGVVLLPFTSRR